MKLTLPGLCILLLTQVLFKVGLDALRGEHRQAPVPPGVRTSFRRATLPAIGGPITGRSSLRRQAHPARPEWVKRVGHLRLIKWSDLHSNYRTECETILLCDDGGRSVARIRGGRVEIERIQDLTEDGIPEVVLRTFSGVSHGGNAYYIYSAGARPRCLLAYDKQNEEEEDVEHWPDFEVRDLAADGRKEIITWYDGFACWNDVDEWSTCYLGSAHIPIVLGLRRGRYTDVTSECRPWLRRKLARAKRHFLNDLKEAGERGPVEEFAQGMIEYYSVALLLHGGTTARSMVLRLLPRQTRHFFLEHCSLIEKVLADRWKRYAYPPAYGNKQAFSAHADPLADTADVSGQE